ncbi:MAG TPA: pentapeptide repeat-containing protein [Hyphomicrobiaceae bacterium]|nr:pentapeptide repeat-containing protein [Hyphomicrobiaceae bacterium]
MRSAKLDGATLRHAGLIGAVLEFASLREADLSGTSLAGCAFAEADLTGANVTGINTDDWKPQLLELRPKPCRCRACLEANASHMRRMGCYEVSDRSGIGGNHSLALDRACLIDNTHGRLLQRHVQSDIVLHRKSP